MTRQTKNVSLQEYKSLDDTTAGGFSAYATIFGELDDTGDIILPGAYKNTIPQFLKRGFIARSHDWSTAIGMPTAAEEDGRGLVVEARYHNTPEAQNQRLILNERRDAGMDAFVSIGFDYPEGTPIFVRRDDYATEIPKYSAPSLVQQNLEKAQRFPEVRVLPAIHLYEISVVQVPALASASVTGAKEGSLPAGLPLDEHSKSVLAAVGEYAHREADLSELRTKEGRPISEARRARISAIVGALDGLAAVRDDLQSLLDETQPKPKDDEQTEEGEKAVAHVAALLREHHVRQARMRALLRS